MGTPLYPLMSYHNSVDVSHPHFSLVLLAVLSLGVPVCLFIQPLRSTYSDRYSHCANLATSMRVFCCSAVQAKQSVNTSYCSVTCTEDITNPNLSFSRPLRHASFLNRSSFPVLTERSDVSTSLPSVFGCQAALFWASWVVPPH